MWPFKKKSEPYDVLTAARETAMRAEYDAALAEGSTNMDYRMWRETQLNRAEIMRLYWRPRGVSDPVAKL